MNMHIPTNNDALMNELRGDVERERWAHIWNKYKAPILTALALIIIGTGAHSFWKQQQAEKNMALTDALYTSFSAEGKAAPAEAAQKLQQFAEANKDTNAAFMADIQAAALFLQAENTAGALERLNHALAMPDADSNLKAVATIMYVQAALDTEDAAPLQDRLKPYLADDNAYRFQAWELAALLAYKQGDGAKAQEYLGKITSDTATPESARGRAGDLARVLK
ncbi:MAG: tetratricopeptide repeat protein [Bdellovibrionales bacterium]